MNKRSRKRLFLVVQKIRDSILDETFKPGERLPESGLGEMFKVSRSPVREALFALESEGTVIMEPYKGAILKPLSPEEALDIAELRLVLISLAAKPAHRHLSPAQFAAIDSHGSAGSRPSILRWDCSLTMVGT
jgi:DNA-binding GntR family transcriptional regulator